MKPQRDLTAAPLVGPSKSLQDIIRSAEVHYKTVGNMVCSVIREAVLSGVFEPGERLRQDALADALGVSRMPVRSALLQLESEGLIEFHPHRGAVVSKLTPEQVRQVYEIRILLESHALRKAFEKMDSEKVGHLEELANELDLEQGGERFLQLRVAFYRELYDAEHNSLLISMIDRLRSEVGRYWLELRVAHGSEPGHRQLLKYLRSGDADGAEGWLREHLERVGEELAKLVAPN
jgi:DNA-binding GntR family transcriptional regulator